MDVRINALAKLLDVGKFVEIKVLLPFGYFNAATAVSRAQKRGSRMTRYGHWLGVDVAHRALVRDGVAIKHRAIYRHFKTKTTNRRTANKFVTPFAQAPTNP